MNLKMFGVAFGVLPSVLVSLASTADYENDFTVRTGAVAVPMTDWVTVQYNKGEELYRNYMNTGETVDANMTGNNQGQSQDGWEKANAGYGGRNKNQVRFTASETANPCGVFSSPRIDVSSVAHQPLRNAIGSGCVRVSCDIRAPGKAYGTGNCRFRLETQELMEERNNTNVTRWLFELGFHIVTNEAGSVQSTMSLVYGDGAGKVSAAGSDAATTPLCWYRFTAELDIANNVILRSTMSELGTAAPTFETAGTVRASVLDKHFLMNLSEKTGPITGFSVHADALSSKAYFGDPGYESDAAQMVDNLRVEWKAEASGEYVDLYRNDFNESKRRTLAPAGTTSCVYSDGKSVTSTNSFTYPASIVRRYGDFDANNTAPSLVPAAVAKVYPQPIGLDGWRRHNPSGAAQVFVTTNAAGNRMLGKLCKSSAFTIVTQMIGEEITNGTVRLDVDMRVPESMSFPAAVYGAYASLVPASLWADSSESPNTGNFVASSAGFRGNSSTDLKTVYPFHTGTSIKTGGALINKDWYRLSLVANLDTKKYDYAIRHIGSEAIGMDDELVDPTPVATAANCSFATGKTDSGKVGAIALITYSVTNSIESSVFYDNIRVWRDVGTTTERVVYQNDFTTRKRVDVLPRKSLTPVDPIKKDRMFEGVDLWQRNNAGDCDFFIRGSQNPCLGVDARAQSSYGYVNQPLGRSYRRGVMQVRVDMRPPSMWTGDNRWAGMLLGGDELLTGNLGSGNASMLKNYHYWFRFLPDSNSSTSYGAYTSSDLYIHGDSSQMVLSSADPTHWYRVVGEIDLNSHVGDFKIYDQGAGHPSACDDNGALVKSIGGLRYYSETVDPANAEKVSTLGFSAGGCSSYAPWLEDAPGTALFDNVVVGHSKPGLGIVVR